jgi:hypothetical protein
MGTVNENNDDMEKFGEKISEKEIIKHEFSRRKGDIFKILSKLFEVISYFSDKEYGNIEEHARTLVASAMS